MRKYHCTRAGLISSCLLMLVYGSVQFIGCDEAPFAPKDDDPPKDYRIYYSHWLDEGWVFWYKPIAGEFDSAAIPWDTTKDWFFTAKGPTVSHDGRLLYQPLAPKVSVFNTETWELVTELPYYVWSEPIVTSPGGQYVALPGDTLRILRTSDYSVVYTDPQRTVGGHFPISDERYYYAAGETIHVIDLNDPDSGSTSVTLTGGHVYRILTTPDESKWILYANLGSSVSAFAVYDVDRDLVIFSHPHWPGTGDIAITPDGKRAFFTNPGNLGSMPGDCQIMVFDVESNQIDRIISTYQYFDRARVPCLTIRSMVVTPDGQSLIGLDVRQLPSSFIRCDLREERMVDWFLTGKDFSRMSIRYTQ